jgi:hypothetical protein
MGEIDRDDARSCDFTEGIGELWNVGWRFFFKKATLYSFQHTQERGWNYRILSADPQRMPSMLSLLLYD